jgi:hypothetical protein
MGLKFLSGRSSRPIGYCAQSAVAIATAMALSSGAAQAASLRLGDLTFGEVAGDFQITGGSIDNSFYTIRQSVFGPNINLLMSIDGFPSLYPYIGVRVQTMVTNNTGTPWIFFDNELRENTNIPSPEQDGLSFAQGIGSVRPFTSDRFSRADEVTDVRDFINFSNGTVNPGETVTFRFAITDRSPISRFYLLERPNFAPGGTGFVTVPPVTPPSPPVVVMPDPPVGPPPKPPKVPRLPQNLVMTAPPQPSPPVQPSPSIEPSPPVAASPPSIPPVITPPPPPLPPAPGEAAAVPEPTTLLGLLAALGGGAILKRSRHRSPSSKQD